MIHKDRAYSVRTAETADELAGLLSEMTWCGCNGFRLGDVLYLNDAFSPDGAQEYAVIEIRGEDAAAWAGMQFESITVSWMDREELLKSIEEYGDPEERRRLYSGAAMAVPVRIARHPAGPCYLCA